MGISGSKLKQLREQRKKSPNDVATFLGISRPAYLKYENGSTKMPRQLEKLAKFFCVTTDYLLDNEENVKKPEDYLSDDEKKLVRNYRWLDEDGKNIILSVIGRFNGERVTETSQTSTVKINSENGSNYGVVGGNFNSTVNLR